MTVQTEKLMTAEASVHERYAAASKQVELALCCPVNYTTDYLRVIPTEVLERDYGCGDPSPYVRPGETVLDLGAGGGKLGFIASQLVGPQGRVIGVDCNRDMLDLARWAAPQVADKLGYANVDFRFGLIQDLKLDLDLLEVALKKQPIQDSTDFLRSRQLQDELRQQRPLIADQSVDCVVSNCVLNLVRQEDRQQLFCEIFRVLRAGGRCAISDIVSDESVPPDMQRDPELWSGCLSGAFREDEFLQAFAQAGFQGIQIAKRSPEPWRVVNGIEFRSLTVLAYKLPDGPCLDRHQAIIYRGPFKEVIDDQGHVFVRGQRVAVCDRLYQALQQAPFRELFEPVPPRVEVPMEQAAEFACLPGQLRSPAETKGGERPHLASALELSTAARQLNSDCRETGCC